TFYPHPAICPLWAFPMATHEEPEPIPPKRSLRLRPWKRGREGEYGGGTEGGDKFVGAHPVLSSLSGLTRQSATLPRALNGLGCCGCGGTHICCAYGTLAGPRVKPEDDEGGEDR